jgi:riboflavin kinase / FMN adenylyltransferase
VTTRFTTKQIKGKGRGKFLGYPTINLEVPAGFELSEGIYAAWVTIDGTRFRGALHWGPIPTFDEEAKSLEVYVLGVGDHELMHADLSAVTVEPVARLRNIGRFATIAALTRQIELDIIAVRKNLRDFV